MKDWVDFDWMLRRSNPTEYLAEFISYNPLQFQITNSIIIIFDFVVAFGCRHFIKLSMSILFIEWIILIGQSIFFFIFEYLF